MYSPSPLITNPNARPYKTIYNWLVILPIVAVVFLVAFSGRINFGAISIYIILTAATVPTLVLLVKQWIYFKSADYRRKMRMQYLLLIAALALPLGGALVGDVYGAAHFSDRQDLFQAVGVGLIIGGILAGILVLMLIVGNLFFIKKQPIGSVIRVLSKIVYILGCISVAVVSLLAYSIIYTLHDPSTE